MAGRVDVDVAVVGAGLAGLAAGRALAVAGASAVIVEARDRVGGRIENQILTDGTVVEVGGAFVGPGQDRMYELVAELGLATYPTHTAGDDLVVVGGRARRARKGHLPPLNPLVVADLLQAFARIDRMSRQVPVERPWEAPRAEAWDGTTLATWLRRNVRTRTARALVQVATEVGQAADPAEVSILHIVHSIGAAGGVASATSTAGGAQQDRVVDGAHGVAAALAARLGDAVRLQCPVERVVQDADGVTVVAGGAPVRAGRVIVALPPALAGRIAYDPPLPADRDQLTQRVIMGTIVKCMAIYARPFWRDDGLSGEAVIDQPPVRACIDASPASGVPGVLLGFVGGRTARALARLPVDERRRSVVDGFATAFGPAARSPVDYVDKAWADDPWSRGCYSGLMPPGAWTQLGPALRAPVGRIHWAGTETAGHWTGYMEGAVRSGERAAAEVLAQL